MKSLNNKIVVLQSLLVAFFADIRCINWGLTQGSFVGEGVMALLYIGVVGLIMLSVVFSQMKLRYNFRTYSVFFLLYLLLYYALTSAFVAPPVISVPFFLIFTITAFILPHLTKVDAKIMLKAMIIYPFFSIFRLQSIFASTLSWKMALPMDVSYGYLIPIVANIVFLAFYFKEERTLAKVVMILFSLINLVFFIQILLFGSRGPLLCVFLLICVLCCLKLDSHKKVKVNKRRVRITLITGIFVAIFFIPFLSLLEGWLANWDIEVSAISKIIRLQAEEGDFSNGRDELNTLTWNGIYNSPIFGHGLDQYDNNHPGESYPHNFLLQILYDGGIWLFLIMSPIFIQSIKFLKDRSYSEYAIYLTLFFASVPGALFSQDLWNIPVLWMFFGFVVSKVFVVTPK